MNPLELFPNERAFGNEQAPAPPLAPQLVLTIDEAARRLGIGRSLMYSLVLSGEVESVRIGRLRRIPTDALETFVVDLRTRPSGDAA